MSGGTTDFDYISMDAWHLEGDTIIAADFGGSDDFAGTFAYDMDPVTSWEVNQWAECDDMELIYSRSGDHAYFYFRLSGDSPGTRHYVTLEAT